MTITAPSDDVTDVDISDDAGRFSFAGLPAGEARVQVEHAFRVMAERTLAIDDGGLDDLELSFVLDAPRETSGPPIVLPLAGRVTRPDASPAAGLVVRATSGWEDDPLEAVTDAEGRYRLATTSDATWTVRVASPGAEPAFDVEPGRDDLDLVAPETGTLRLHLVRDDGLSLPGVAPDFPDEWIAWRRLGERRFTAVRAPWTDSRGDLEFELPLGPVELRFGLGDDERRAPGCIGPIEVTRDPDAPRVVVTLERTFDTPLRFVPPLPSGQSVHLLHDDLRDAVSTTRDTGAWIPGEPEVIVAFGPFEVWRDVVDGARLRRGHHVLLSCDPRAVFEPAEFDVPLPEGSELVVHWHAR